MILPEYENYDALGLAELVRKKEITPQELVNAAIERAEIHNPKLNAIIHAMYESARDTATKPLPDGPFAGVPFLIKDLVASIAHEPVSSGSKAYKGYIADHDSELVMRFRKSGVIIMGKTNTPEFGLMGVTEPEAFGPTRNPWDTNLTPGGSSGGAGSAVAAGITPIASGGDGGGSIRIPASCCGIFGLKPSRGRTPTGPDYGELWQGAAVEHILSRSVRDSAAMLDATWGDDPGAPYTITPPVETYLSKVSSPIKKARIGYCTESPLGTSVHDDCKKAVLDAVALLKSLGHDVEEEKPKVDGKAVAVSYLMMYFGEMAAEQVIAKRILKNKYKRRNFEIATRVLALLGKSYSAGDFALAMHTWHTTGRQMGEYHKKYDFYLTPTMAYPPSKIGELLPKAGEKVAMAVIDFLGLGKLLKATGIVNQLAIKSLERSPFTQLANITGQPAMSVPLHWAGNVPIGVQFIAPMGREDSLFSLAGQLEIARPWFQKRPNI